MSGAGTIAAIRLLARLPPGALPAHAARLDHIARGGLVREFAEQLDESAVADRRVVLIRKLRIRGRLVNHSTDRELAGAWARLLADRVLRTANENDKPDDVRVFCDRDEWIAASVCDVLVRGTTNPTWWYGPLAQVVAGKPLPQAVMDLIGHLRSHRLAVLAHIDRRGALAGLIDVLSPSDRKTLLASAVGPADLDAAANDRRRPILAAALEVLDLDLAPSEMESLLAKWHAEAEIDELDWRSRSALADAVLTACRFLVRSGRIDQRRLTAAARGPAPAWLDRERLRRGLADRKAATETAALHAIVAAIQSAIGGSRSDPDRLVLSALARLANVAPGVAAGAHTQRLVQLSAPLALRLAALPASARASAVKAYRNGKGPLSKGSGGAGERALRRSIASILQATIAAPARSTGETASSECVSACAGVAVMLRAFTDFNLASALATARVTAPSLPEFPGVIAAALLCAWAGPCSAHSDGRLDAAISLLLGDRVPDNVADLAAALARIEPSALDALACAVDGMIAFQNPAARSYEVSESDLAALAGSTALPLDPLISRIAARLLTHWSRWLSGFDRSSCVWLLEHAVRRRGRIAVAGEGLVVHIPPLPLDIPLRRAGYLDPLAPPDWLPWNRIAFQVDDGAS